MASTTDPPLASPYPDPGAPLPTISLVDFTARTRVLHTPELIELILLNLAPKQLLRCSLVCKSFEGVASPILWRHVTSGRKDSNTPFGEIERTPAHDGVLGRYATVMTHRPHNCSTPGVSNTYAALMGRSMHRIHGPEERYRNQLPNIRTVIIELEGKDYIDMVSFCPLYEACKPSHLVIRLGKEPPLFPVPQLGGNLDKVQRVTLVIDGPFDVLSINPFFTHRSTASAMWLNALPQCNDLEKTFVLMPDAKWDGKPSILWWRQNLEGMDGCETRGDLNPAVMTLARAVVYCFCRLHEDSLTAQQPTLRPAPNKLQFFNLQLLSTSSLVYVRKAAREYMITLVKLDSMIGEWVTANFEDSDLRRWFGENVEWGGIRKFLDRSWDDVFEIDQLRRLVQRFKFHFIPTDYCPHNRDDASDYGNDELDTSVTFDPFSHFVFPNVFGNDDDDADDGYDDQYPEDDYDNSYDAYLQELEDEQIAAEEEGYQEYLASMEQEYADGPEDDYDNYEDYDDGYQAWLDEIEAEEITAEEEAYLDYLNSMEPDYDEGHYDGHDDGMDAYQAWKDELEGEAIAAEEQAYQDYLASMESDYEDGPPDDYGDNDDYDSYDAYLAWEDEFEAEQMAREDAAYQDYLDSMADNDEGCDNYWDELEAEREEEYQMWLEEMEVEREEEYQAWLN